jgi:HTTM domain
MTGQAGRIAGWFAPSLPEARVAVLRIVCYLFAGVDVLAFVNDVIAKAQLGAPYSPLALARLLHLPAPTPVLAYTLQAVILVGGLVAATGRLPRLVGYPVAAAFLWWVLLGMSYGKVDHDHLALVVALAVLPSAGRCRLASTASNRAAGWTLRCIQMAVVATYLLSAITKVRGTGWIGWPASAVLAWAFVRRPNPVNALLVEQPGVLVAMQWTVYVAEWLAPLALFLRGRALAVIVCFWLGFHAVTFALMGIHFLPTVVCWAAFMPLEKIPAAVAKRRERWRRRSAAPASAAQEAGSAVGG